MFTAIVLLTSCLSKATDLFAACAFGRTCKTWSDGRGAQVRLPRLEHTCSSLFPRCIGNQCLLRIDIVYPKGVHTRQGDIRHLSSVTAFMCRWRRVCSICATALQCPQSFKYVQQTWLYLSSCCVSEQTQKGKGLMRSICVYLVMARQCDTAAIPAGNHHGRLPRAFISVRVIRRTPGELGLRVPAVRQGALSRSKGGGTVVVAKLWI